MPYSEPPFRAEAQLDFNSLNDLFGVVAGPFLGGVEYPEPSQPYNPLLVFQPQNMMSEPNSGAEGRWMNNPGVAGPTASGPWAQGYWR